MGLQGNQKLTGSSNVMLCFPPYCLGCGGKTQLIRHLTEEKTGAKIPWCIIWSHCSPCDSPVSFADESGLFHLQVGCLRTRQRWQRVCKPTPSRAERLSLATLGSMSLREHALSLFRSAVGTVRPAPMLKRALKLQGEGCPQLLVSSRAFPLKRDLYLVGFGKAVLGMAAAAEEILGDHLVRGIINVPLGIQESLQRAGMQ